MIGRIFIVLALAIPGIARACTVCTSEDGRAVRAGVFDVSFLPNLAQVLAPFPLVLLAILALHRFLPD